MGHSPWSCKSRTRLSDETTSRTRWERGFENSALNPTPSFLSLRERGSEQGNFTWNKFLHLSEPSLENSGHPQAL